MRKIIAEEGCHTFPLTATADKRMAAIWRRECAEELKKTKEMRKYYTHDDGYIRFAYVKKVSKSKKTVELQTVKHETVNRPTLATPARVRVHWSRDDNWHPLATARRDPRRPSVLKSGTKQSGNFWYPVTNNATFTQSLVWNEA